MQLWNTSDCREKSFPKFEVRFGLVRGKLMLFNIIEKSRVIFTDFWERLQFVNLVKRQVFDLTKIPFLKHLIGISCLIVEVLKDHNLLTESNLANWFSSYVQFCLGCHFSEWAEAARYCGKMNHLKQLCLRIYNMCPWIHNLLPYLNLSRYEILCLTSPHNQSELSFFVCH